MRLWVGFFCSETLDLTCIYPTVMAATTAAGKTLITDRDLFILMRHYLACSIFASYT